MMTSAAERPSSGWISTGMPRPLSETVTDSSAWMVTTMRSQWPARDSSIELSTTSNTMWCSPVPSSVSPMYIPGRFRTASRPFKTLITGVVDVVCGHEGTRFCDMTLYRLHPPGFHAERPFRRPEQPRFGVQRSDNQLAPQPLHLLDESLQALTIELGRRVIQEQGRSGLRRLLQKPQLRHRHGRRDH